MPYKYCLFFLFLLSNVVKLMLTKDFVKCYLNHYKKDSLMEYAKTFVNLAYLANIN